MEFLIIGLIIAVVYFVIVEMVRSKAKAEYQASLAQLRANPANASLRQRTLTLGRNYSALTRNNKGVTIFDEMALMNDINAACGGTAVLSNTLVSPNPYAHVATAVPITSAPVEDRLARLTKMRQQELISDAEYQSKRQQLLDEM